MRTFKIGLSTTAEDEFGIQRRDSPITVLLLNSAGEVIDSWPHDNLFVAVQEAKNDCEPGDQVEFF